MLGLRGPCATSAACNDKLERSAWCDEGKLGREWGGVNHTYSNEECKMVGTSRGLTETDSYDLRRAQERLCSMEAACGARFRSCGMCHPYSMKWRQGDKVSCVWYGNTRGEIKKHILHTEHAPIRSPPLLLVRIVVLVTTTEKINK